MKKPKKIMIATPMYGGMCTASYLDSMLNFNSACMQNGIYLTFVFMSNESLIQRARNTLANIFYRDTDCDYLMFIDADIGFNANSIIEMMNHDKDVMCGVYPKKEINWAEVRMAVEHKIPDNELKYYAGSLVFNSINFSGYAESTGENPLIEVRWAGTGFMMIKRHVFTELKKHVNRYMRTGMPLYVEMTDQNSDYEYFGCSIQPDTNIYMSEDYHFCEEVRKLGFKIYIAPKISLTHTGSHVFEGRFNYIPDEKNKG
jgi:hypothetical protein